MRSVYFFLAGAGCDDNSAWGGMPTNNNGLSRVFCELSAVLTGEASVSPVIAERHLKPLLASAGAEQIDAMLPRFAELTSGEHDPGHLNEKMRAGGVSALHTPRERFEEKRGKIAKPTPKESEGGVLTNDAQPAS